jgi:hypothetical protein
MSDSIKLSSVALDCPDAGKLAAFYAGITGGKVTFVSEDWAAVRCPGGRIDFQTAAFKVVSGDGVTCASLAQRLFAVPANDRR